MSRLEHNSEVKKGKSKGNKHNEKAQTEFYQVNIYITYYFLFHCLFYS